ncbi:MAG: histidine triad nucleotide-binding protein [Candidatus Omnitrophica bacterium]|nr:histidine triad nucleotide-binding protein [Candidatus Omnitrophota bacterium]
MNDNCIFCKIVNKDIETEFVYEDDDIVVFKDINSQAPIHLLFIPKKHIETLNDISDEDSVLLSKMLMKIRDVAKSRGIAEDGYRVVVNCNRNAGQEVFHLHAHLLGGRGFSWPPG